MTDAKEDNPLPTPGSKVICINNTDRPELELGKEYTVVFEPGLDRCQINYQRYQPTDYRLIGIRMVGQKDAGIFPNGVFEQVK